MQFSYFIKTRRVQFYSKAMLNCTLWLFSFFIYGQLHQEKGTALTVKNGTILYSAKDTISAGSVIYVIEGTTLTHTGEIKGEIHYDQKLEKYEPVRTQPAPRKKNAHKNKLNNLVRNEVAMVDKKKKIHSNIPITSEYLLSSKLNTVSVLLSIFPKQFEGTAIFVGISISDGWQLYTYYKQSIYKQSIEPIGVTISNHSRPPPSLDV